MTDQPFEVRLAANTAEIQAAQALRYRVFYQEMQARPSAEMAALERDFDEYDPISDHLLVIDQARGAVVGTYRLLLRSALPEGAAFYTAGEYDIACLADCSGEVLELGRSCVDSDYRNRTTMQFLWRGIAEYVFANDIALMFGCASLPGTDPDALEVPLSYLHHHHLAPREMRPVAVESRYVAMERLAAHRLDSRRALASLPPLIKGYLRLGGHVGDGAVIDEQFNTTDICMVVETASVSERYYRHYSREVGHEG